MEFQSLTVTLGQSVERDFRHTCLLGFNVFSPSLSKDAVHDSGTLHGRGFIPKGAVLMLIPDVLMLINLREVQGHSDERRPCREFALFYPGFPGHGYSAGSEASEIPCRHTGRIF